MELDNVIGRLSLPELATSEFVIPDDSQVALTGPRGVWGRALLLVNAADGRRACATITVSTSPLRSFSDNKGSVAPCNVH